MPVREKRRATVYIDSDVLEFLSLRSTKGEGSVSEQIEHLARTLMRRESTSQERQALEERHRRGYEQHPVQPDEFDALIASQVVTDG